MAASTTTVVERTSEPPSLRAIPRIRVLAAHREILMNLIRKDLKVKYAASILGAVWSVLNPIVFLAVFSFVVVVTGNRLPNFPIYLLSGLLAWNLFSNSLLQGARSVIDNGNLVKKVAFPREVLPLASVGVAIVDFVLQSAVLLVFMLATGYGFHASIALYPLAIITLLVFTLAATFWVAALNVRYRDVQHLLALGLLVWFWFTPIVYQGALVQTFLSKHANSLWNLYLLNPLADIVLGFQRALYAIVTPTPTEHVLPATSLAWSAWVLVATLGASLLLLSYTWRLFFRLSGDFAEEL